MTGNGQVEARPDVATVTLGVSHDAREARDAMARVNEDMARLFERLADLGVAPRDMQTTTLRLDPVWRNDGRAAPREDPVISGFVARNDLTIRLRDMDRLGEVLEVLLDDGANRFSGISFGVDDPEPLRDQAREQAVGDARRKAELYARAAGVTLGDVLQISEPGAGSSPMPSYARAEAVTSAMPVAGGELTFGAQVTIVYALSR